MVAAVLAHNLRMYHRHHVHINARSLAYGFNPDVVYDKSDVDHLHPMLQKEAERKHTPYNKVLLPTEKELRASAHTQHISAWLKKIE